MHSSDVTAIVTAHHEAQMLIPAISSMRAASDKLRELGVSVQQLLVCDALDRPTKKLIDSGVLGSDLDICIVNYGDQGKTRNHAVGLANGEFIAFLDGDDLWSENWLVEAYKLARSDNEKRVIYPEFNWYFGDLETILCQVDDGFPWFDAEALRVVNLWDALCFCPKSIYVNTPFKPRQIKQGFAFEDWNWNRRVMEAGIGQSIAKNTIIFKRRRLKSQGAEATRRDVIAEPSESSYYDFWKRYRA